MEPVKYIGVQKISTKGRVLSRVLPIHLFEKAKDNYRLATEILVSKKVRSPIEKDQVFSYGNVGTSCTIVTDP